MRVTLHNSIFSSNVGHPCGLDLVAAPLLAVGRRRRDYLGGKDIAIADPDDSEHPAKGAVSDFALLEVEQAIRGSSGFTRWLGWGLAVQAKSLNSRNFVFLGFTTRHSKSLLRSTCICLSSHSQHGTNFIHSESGDHQGLTPQPVTEMTEVKEQEAVNPKPAGSITVPDTAKLSTVPAGSAEEWEVMTKQTTKDRPVW